MRRVVLGLVAATLAVTAHAQYARPDLEPMPTGIGPTFVEIDGEIYGAKPDERGPIGGGEGYQRILTGGDYHVSTVAELLDALAEVESGETIFLDPEGDYNFTGLVFAEEFEIKLPAGVTLASDRGNNGSRGAVIYSDAHKTPAMIRPLGPGVRVTGLWLRGPKPQWHIEHHRRSFTRDDDGNYVHHDEEGDGGGHAYYYRFPTSAAIIAAEDDLEVDNCEISGWTRGIVVTGSQGIHVHHCYIHHQQYHGLGYGMTHQEGRSLVEYNLFDVNRHSIAATGRPGDAYEARHNVELYTARSFPFDMHGGRDRGDGTDIAGDWVKIHNNQFRATDQRAIGIRGVPREESTIHRNWFYHEEPGPGVIMPWPCDEGTNITFENNAFGEQDPVVR